MLCSLRGRLKQSIPTAVYRDGPLADFFYVPVYQPILSWFPERKGLIAGFMGVGQGVGGMTWNGAAPVLGELASL